MIILCAFSVNRCMWASIVFTPSIELPPRLSNRLAVGSLQPGLLRDPSSWGGGGGGEAPCAKYIRYAQGWGEGKGSRSQQLRSLFFVMPAVICSVEQQSVVQS